MTGLSLSGVSAPQRIARKGSLWKHGDLLVRVLASRWDRTTTEIPAHFIVFTYIGSQSAGVMHEGDFRERFSWVAGR